MTGRLALPPERLRDRYDAVVVGSGYGGAIAAARLARAGRRVCLLERGKEYPVGAFPTGRRAVLREFQADLPTGRIGSRTGLYDLHVNPDVNVFVGCGLGGTSLVNANVSLPPEPRVFEDPRWPAALRRDRDGGLAAGFARAAAMLQPVAYPAGAPALAKLEALERSAAALGAPFRRLPINVTFADGVNAAGVSQRGCTLCGDCVTGCNHGAKNTVMMNYLPDAVRHGAEIFTRVSVRHLERDGAGWVVHAERLDGGTAEAARVAIRAEVVVLGAGTLGSTGILLRSRERGLPVSDRLGHGFTGNGDAMAFSYNGEDAINAMGFGRTPPGRRRPVGPTVTGVIDLRERPELDHGMVVEEGAIPGPLAGLMPRLFPALARVVGQDPGGDWRARARRRLRELKDLLPGPSRGAMRHTQMFLVMTHEEGAGRIVLRDDRVRVEWPGVGAQPAFQRVDRNLEAAARPLGGTFVRNPGWNRLMGHHVVTVHPLGGCVMGEDAAGGVVNDRGQVYAGAQGGAVHPGLLVCDGAIIPRSLGVNPLLTISAVAERAMDLLVRDHGWVPSVPSPAGGA